MLKFLATLQPFPNNWRRGFHKAMSGFFFLLQPYYTNYVLKYFNGHQTDEHNDDKLITMERLQSGVQIEKNPPEFNRHVFVFVDLVLIKGQSNYTVQIFMLIASNLKSKCLFVIYKTLFIDTCYPYVNITNNLVEFFCFVLFSKMPKDESHFVGICK